MQSLRLTMYRNRAKERKGAGMADDNSGTLAKVKQIVGKSYKPGKIDAQLAALSKIHDEYLKSVAPFKAAVSTLEKSILALQNLNSKSTNQLKQVNNNVAAADFGLDQSKPDDKKKIDQCKKLLSSRCDEMEKDNDARSKALDEVDKHIDNISGYKVGP